MLATVWILQNFISPVVPSWLHNHIPKFALSLRTHLFDIFQQLMSRSTPKSCNLFCQMSVVFPSVVFPFSHRHTWWHTMFAWRPSPSLCRNWNHLRNSNTAPVKELLLLPLGQALLISIAHGALNSENALCWKKLGKQFLKAVYQTDLQL